MKLSALAFNRQELCLRMGMYPGLAFDKFMGIDGFCESLLRYERRTAVQARVIAAADPKDELLQKRVFFLPMKGWEDEI